MISYPFTFYYALLFNYSFNSAISAYNELILLLTLANVLAINSSSSKYYAVVI